MDSITCCPGDRSSPNTVAGLPRHFHQVQCGLIFDALLNPPFSDTIAFTPQDSSDPEHNLIELGQQPEELRNRYST
jgi:hypothetical protein